MPDKISIRIDGEYVAAQQGQTILEVARASGKYIPTLCWLENLTPVGACRLCIVEVSGVNRLLPACTTPVQDGMSVTTNSEKLKQYRRIALEFLFSERNHSLLRVRLQQPLRAAGHGAAPGRDGVRYPYAYPRLPVDMSHERYVLDHNRCILCTRCVRVCAEVEGAHVWDVSCARHPLHAGMRYEPAVGRIEELHQLRQVRAGVPHRALWPKRDSPWRKW